MSSSSSPSLGSVLIVVVDDGLTCLGCAMLGKALTFSSSSSSGSALIVVADDRLTYLGVWSIVGVLNSCLLLLLLDR